MHLRLMPISVTTAMAFLALAGCKKKDALPAPVTAAEIKPADSGKNADRIVVVQRTSITAEADAKSKSVATVLPGEALTFLGDSVASPSGRDEQFYKVRLSDGTEGWARNYGLVLGQPAAVVADAPLYQRPTNLSPTRQKLPLGQLVGILGEQDGWAHISASRWQTGWIEKSSLSTEGNDILAAALYGGAVGKKTGKDALVAGLAALQGKPCPLVTALQARLDSLNGGVGAPSTTPAPTSPTEDSTKN